MSLITTEGPMVFQIGIVVVSIVVPAVLLVAAVQAEKRWIKKVNWTGK